MAETDTYSPRVCFRILKCEESLAVRECPVLQPAQKPHQRPQHDEIDEGSEHGLKSGAFLLEAAFDRLKGQQQMSDVWLAKAS